MTDYNKSIENIRKLKFKAVNNLPKDDLMNLAHYIKDNNMDDIIQILVDNTNLVNKYFLFEIIYDNKKYENKTMDLINKIEIHKLHNYHITNLLYKTSFGLTFVISNFNNLINKKDSTINTIISFLMANYTHDDYFVKFLSKYKNLHIRYLFMSYIIKYNKEYFDDIYDYFIDLFTLNKTLMDSKEISHIAYLLCKEGLQDKYEQLKLFIYSNYKYNYLASYLLDNKQEEAFKSDSDNLFNTSIDYRLEIYKKYSDYVSKYLIEEMAKNVKYFGDDYVLKKLYAYNLGNKIEELVNKYLSLSTSDECKFIAKGSTTHTYKIGDYAFKLSHSKWSYENELAPRLYMIHKNLEEILIRDEDNIITSAIEVQKYLSRGVKDIEEKYFDLFKMELALHGYYVDDNLRTKDGYDNTAILDSYLDADTTDYESLPRWFKQVPLVLIDKDRVHEIGKVKKQIR